MTRNRLMTLESNQRDRQALRDRLLEATLPHVVFDGWGMAALEAGARDLGLEIGHIHAVFASPTKDLASHFSDWADRRMLLRLSALDLPAMRVRERITLAVRLRLQELAGHQEAVRRLAGFLILPGNASLAARNGYRSVDAIWRVAGDKAVDFNFYTKRALLGAVLVTTTLHWLDDTSADHGETWAFLDRRIAGVMGIPKLQAQAKGFAAKLTKPLRDLGIGSFSGT
jgi:ubiquinone biosynthesis protein COQ9